MIHKSLTQYLILWAGQFASSLGSSMTGFAITIWAYEQTGSALALSFSGIALMVPRMIGGVLAGPLIERLNKKRVMLFTDIGAGLCTICMLVLFLSGSLQLWHIYLLNILTSLLGSFQAPAATVAVSLIVPKEQYTRVGGLEAFKNGTVQVLSPVLAAWLLAVSGMHGVFLFDLLSLLAACATLVLFVRIPGAKPAATAPLNLRNYGAELADGFRVLRRSRLLMTMLAFFAFINLVAGIAYYSLLSPMVLARTGNDSAALALVNGAMGVGGIVGGLIVSVMPSPRRKTTVVFLSAALSFLLGDVLFAVGRTPMAWAAFWRIRSLSRIGRQVVGFLPRLPARGPAPAWR